MTSTNDDSSGADDNARRALEDVLARAADVKQMNIREKLEWLEDAANAADAHLLDDDDDEGKDGALHLRAALGAIVKWSQAKGADGKAPDMSAQSVAQLEMLLKTLIARGLVGLYRSLAAAYDVLAKERAPHRAACVEVRDAFREAARAVERGEPVSTSTREKLERARATLA